MGVRVAVSLLASLAAVVVAGSALVQPAAAADDEFFTFRVCNKTKTEASVAVSALYAPGSPDYIVAGWWNVAGGDCRDIGQYPKGHFYFFAKARRGTSWWGQRDIDLCVEFPGPFKRINFKNYKCANEELKPFRHVVVEKAVYEWSLTP